MLERRPIEKLIPYARNSRTHSDDQVAQIAASIREFGFTNPVLINAEDSIIAGHGRVLAARKLGVADVPVIVLDYLTKTQQRAYILADNKLALNAGWDADLLKLELLDLKVEGMDLGLIGFSDDELGDILADRTDGLTDPDEAPPLEDAAVSRLGDVWLLGPHRLACGDCTEPDTVFCALGGAKPHLMVTDPPYGVDYDANWRNERVRADGSPSDGRAIGKVMNDGEADWRSAWDLFPGSVAYAWHADLRARQVVESLEASKFRMRAQIIWSKSRFAIGRGHYHFMHEPCWYAVRKGATAHWNGDRRQTTIWEINHIRSETGHSTQKPVECMKRPMENNSKPGDAVYDPFVGSGTSLIAAEMTGRRCIAIELSPNYVDLALRRWQAFTGAEAALEGSGSPFAQVRAERLQAETEPENV